MCDGFGTEYLPKCCQTCGYVPHQQSADGKLFGRRVQGPLFLFGSLSADDGRGYDAASLFDVRYDCSVKCDAGVGFSIPIVTNSGIAIPYAATPMLCVWDRSNQIRGFFHRNARQLPNCYKPFRDMLKQWNLYKLKSCLKPIDSLFDQDIEVWLAATHYKGTRKDQLRKAYERIKELYNLSRADFISSSFGKKECSDSGSWDSVSTLYKILRIIQNLSDEFKTMFGPIIKECEKQVFKLKCFIKRIPVNGRAQYLRELFRLCGHFLCSDYESFENMFDAIFMECIEIPFFDYMLQHMLLYPLLMLYIELASMGNNELKFETITAFLRSLRLSGIMWTSLINSWCNFVIQTLVSYLCKVISEHTIEGDDNIKGNDAFTKPVAAAVYQMLGCSVKIICTDSFERESFCGLVFANEDMRNIPDVVYTLQKLGWLPARYRPGNRSENTRMVILKSMALSCLYQNAGAPVVQAAACAIIRCLPGVEIDPDLVPWNWYTQRVQQEIQRYGAVRSRVGEASYRIVEECQGILVEDQKLIERWFDSWRCLQPMDHWFFERYSSSICRDYIRHYASDFWYIKSNLALPAFKPSKGRKRLRLYETVVTVLNLAQKYQARATNNFRLVGDSLVFSARRPIHYSYLDIYLGDVSSIDSDFALTQIQSNNGHDTGKSRDLFPHGDSGGISDVFGIQACAYDSRFYDGLLSGGVSPPQDAPVC